MNFMNKLLGGKERKSLVSNFGYLSLLQIANYIFPFITMPYLARTIGVDGFGKIAFAGAVILWVQTITDWGFNYSATRDVVRANGDKDKVSEIFSDVLWSRLFLMLLSLVVLLILIAFIPVFRQNGLVILVTFLLVPGHIACPEWFFQAKEKMKYITILNVLSKLIFTILVFVVIKTSEDYILQPLLSAFGYLMAGVVAMIIIFREWDVHILKPNFKNMMMCIKGSTDVFINNIIPNIYNSFSVIIMGFWGGPTSNGIFDAGNRFVTVGHQGINIISRSFFPVMARRIDKHTVYAKICLPISLAMSLVLFIAAPLLIKLFFTEEFMMAVVVLRIKALCVFFVALNRVYGINYLLLIGKERILRNITTICSVIGFLIMFPLVYYFDYLGAAITILVTQGVMGSTTCFMANKIKNKTI